MNTSSPLDFSAADGFPAARETSASAALDPLPGSANLRASAPTSGGVRVLLVDDSPVALRLMARLLADSTQVQVVGTAANGREALALLSTTRPNVICTDDAMPVMDGLELTRHIMSEKPLPILVLCEGEVPKSERQSDLIRAGAVDVGLKPAPEIAFDAAALAIASREMIARVRRLAGVVVLSRRSPSALLLASQVAPESGGIKERVGSLSCVEGARPLSPPSLSLRLVAVGASTGGPHALETLLTPLSADFPLPILCVQHISVGFLKGLIEWLDARCALKVMLAPVGVKPQSGTVYFAPEDAHLVLDAEGRMQFLSAPLEDGHRPSVTTLLRSVAERCGASAAGVLLTGMGSDGAQGLLALSQAGGLTFAQDEASCVVYGMPAQAAKLGAARYVMTPAAIAQELMRRVGSQRRKGE